MVKTANLGGGLYSDGKAQKSIGNEIRTEIDLIEQENEELKQILARETRQSRMTQQMTSNQGGEMQRLQKQAANYLRKIEKERDQISQLDDKIAKAQQDIVEQKQKMGGINASRENHAMLTKQIKIMENRLAKALQKFNEQLAQNKQQRQKIDDYRRERVVYDGIYKKLEVELHQKKKEMAAIIEDAKLAYSKSDKSQSEMRALKSQVAKEKEDFEKEWKALGRLMEQERQEREQLRIKQCEEAARIAVERKAAYQQGLQNQAKRGENTRSATSTIQPNENIGKKNNNDMIDNTDEDNDNDYDGGGGGKLSSTMNKKDANPTNQSSNNKLLTRDEAISYEEIFQKLKQETGCQSMKELIDHFQDVEQKNFSLFNSINELNSDIEQCELAIAETKLEIEKYKGQGVSSDTQRKKFFRSLEERLSRTETKVDEYELRHQNAQKTINQLKTGIHSIFSRLGCASTSVEEMLGNQGVTESNMMQYLELIEQRTTEILQAYAHSQAVASGKLDLASTAALQQGIIQPPPPKISVQPPTWDDFSSGDDSDQDDDERPLTREELQRKTLRGLGLKEHKQFGSRPGGLALTKTSSSPRHSQHHRNTKDKNITPHQ
uniref:ODAD1 central coiled coil region domain-containing protein n=1 Tax=Aureoumbra lagunensis TaxID=44058 RepID=A0A7S3K573_9STRA